jgi:hypothetical protein
MGASECPGRALFRLHSLVALSDDADCDADPLSRLRRVGAETVWERIDLPVMRYVAAFDYSLQWQFDHGAPTDELPALTGEELDAALRRLEEYGLIAAGGRTETIGYFLWWRLRLTPDGWRVLGEWPPSSAADMAAALVHILRALAEGTGDEQAKPLRRAAGSVGKLAGNIVFDVAKAELARAGGDIAT